MELLKNISSHHEIEDTVSKPVTFSYIQFETHPNVEEQLELKKEVRGLAIEAIFDPTKVPEYLDAKDDYNKSMGQFDSNVPYGSMSGGASHTYANIIGPKVKTLLANPKQMISPEALQDEIIQEWITQSKKSTCTVQLRSISTNYQGQARQANQLNKIEAGGPDAAYRRLVTRCISSGSMIATTGRIGPATTILANREILNLFPKLNEDSNYMEGVYHIADMIFEFSDLVPKDRLYVIRSRQEKDLKSASMCSIISVLNTTLNQYYLAVFPIIKGNCVELEIV